jgi:phage-related minor tail protein
MKFFSLASTCFYVAEHSWIRTIDQASMGTDSDKQFSETGTDSVSGALALLHELPPLPAAISQLIAALSDDAIDRQRLAAILEQCPSLAAKLVGIASSA